MFNITNINDKAKFYTKELWNKDLDIPIIINKRLTRTLGWYVHNEKIELSPQILLNEYILDDVLLHELCHWYCHVEGKRYKDYENDFENELERIGSTSSYYGGYQTTTLNNQKMLGYQYHYLGYTCEVCGKHFKTTEYLEDKVEGEIGRKYKNYLCCNTKMKVDTSDYLVEEFRPSEKLLSLNGKYKNRQ